MFKKSLLTFRSSCSFWRIHKKTSEERPWWRGSHTSAGRYFLPSIESQINRHGIAFCAFIPQWYQDVAEQNDKNHTWISPMPFHWSWVLDIGPRRIVFPKPHKAGLLLFNICDYLAQKARNTWCKNSLWWDTEVVLGVWCLSCSETVRIDKICLSDLGTQSFIIQLLLT